MNLPTIDWLRANCQMIHYFGLGFIQLKVDQESRYHFYTSELPAIIPVEDIHNHRYDFHSRVLKGALFQELFSVIPGDTHVREFESCKESVEAVGDGGLCGIISTSSHKHVSGSEYFISHETFHRVWAKSCVTMLLRSEYKKDQAEVIRPVNSTKVCPFSHKVEEGKLWEIVAEMLKGD